MPLRHRLKESGTITRRSARLSSLKVEQIHKPIVTRTIDRAVSLPLERKSYVSEYLPEEKERGYSVQRDEVNFNDTLSI